MSSVWSAVVWSFQRFLVHPCSPRTGRAAPGPGFREGESSANGHGIASKLNFEVVAWLIVGLLTTSWAWQGTEILCNQFCIQVTALNGDLAANEALRSKGCSSIGLLFPSVAVPSTHLPVSLCLRILFLLAGT